MSSNRTIILTSDDEHWFSDCSEPLSRDQFKDAITLEFSKKNVRLDVNNDDEIIITITNPNCEIYDIFSDLEKRLR